MRKMSGLMMTITLVTMALFDSRAGPSALPAGGGLVVALL